MSNFSNRLKQLRNNRRISQEKLGKLIGMSKSSVNMYERGEREPGLETLEALADFFNVDLDYLLGKSDTPNFTLISTTKFVHSDMFIPNMSTVPLYGAAACGQPIYAPNEPDAHAFLPEGFNADFALRARGDSMIGVHINNGDIVFFLSANIVENGQIAAICIGEEMTIKRVYYHREQNELRLVSENPAFATMVFSGTELDQIRIVGRAVAHMRPIR